MKTQSLLEKAQSIPPKKVGALDIPTAVAWVNDEVRTAQVLSAMGLPETFGTRIYTLVSRSIREGVRSGKLKIVVVE